MKDSGNKTAVVIDNQQHLQHIQHRQQHNKPFKIRIHQAGGIFETLVIEPLGYGQYIYICDKKKGIAQVEFEEEGKKKIPYLKIGDGKVYFQQNKAFMSKPAFAVPSKDACERWVYELGDYESKKPSDLYEEIKNYLRLLFDIEGELSYSILALGVFQSWLARFLNTVFYHGFDAKPGSGKTSCLEGLALLCRHGCLVGDTSVAMIGRIVDEQQLSLFVDEIDEHPDLFPILRQGYRKGTPYSRLHPKTYRLESFDVYGYKAFSFASQVEKALKGRTVVDTLRPSTDQRLPILNSFKQELGRPLFEDLFFWYMDNASDFVVRVVSVVCVSVVARTPSQDISQQREDLYNKILDELGFTIKEEEALCSLFGRNLELAFNSLVVARELDLPIQSEIKESFLQRQQQEEVFVDNHYLEILQEYLIEQYEERKDAERGFAQLTTGKFAGCWYVKRALLLDGFNNLLLSKSLKTVSLGKFREYLKEFDWVASDNVCRQRDPLRPSNQPECVVFDKRALNKLYEGNVPEEADWSVKKEVIGHAS